MKPINYLWITGCYKEPSWIIYKVQIVLVVESIKLSLPYLEDVGKLSKKIVSR